MMTALKTRYRAPVRSECLGCWWTGAGRQHHGPWPTRALICAVTRSSSVRNRDQITPGAAHHQGHAPGQSDRIGIKPARLRYSPYCSSRQFILTSLWGLIRCLKLSIWECLMKKWQSSS